MSKNTLQVYVQEYKKNGMVKMEETFGSEFETSVTEKIERAKGDLQKCKEEDVNLSFNFRTGPADKAENLQLLKNDNSMQNFSGKLNGLNETNVQESLTMSLDPKVAAELKKLKGEDDWNTLMKELLELRKQKLEQEKPLSVETDSRHIPERIKKFVLQRTRGQCAYPDCIKKGTILHHTQRFALQNIHDPDQLFPLCKDHERLAHHGLIANEEQEIKKWRILDRPIWWEMKRKIDQRVVIYRTPAGQHDAYKYEAYK